jgi:hypothetical protein
VAHCKRPWMELSQPAETASVPDRGLAQAQILQLRTSHYPVLAVSQLGYRPLRFASP